LYCILFNHIHNPKFSPFNELFSYEAERSQRKTNLGNYGHKLKSSLKVQMCEGMKWNTAYSTFKNWETQLTGGVCPVATVN
jgi:hypothetical protein